MNTPPTLLALIIITVLTTLIYLGPIAFLSPTAVFTISIAPTIDVVLISAAVGIISILIPTYFYYKGAKLIKEYDNLRVDIMNSSQQPMLPDDLGQPLASHDSRMTEQKQRRSSAHVRVDFG